MNRKILVIDDEEDICEVIKDCLSDRNLTVFTALNANDALSIVEMEQPSLVLLDVLLPGMDGLECLKLIKARVPDTIVVMLSGMKDESIAKQAIKRGAYDYVTKPFNLDDFERQILQRIYPT